MQRILRSLIYQDPTEKDVVAANYDHVRPERLLYLPDRERAVLEYLLDFQSRHAEPPAHRVTYEHFETLHALEECSLIEEFGSEVLREGASFAETFEEVVARQGTSAMKQVFRDAVAIATEGLEIQKGEVIRGISSAVSYVFTSLQTPPQKTGARVAPDMTESAQALRDLYQDRADNPSTAFGVMSGYRVLDAITGGVRKGGLYIHAGFAAHLKSTFVLNCCVNAVTRGWDPIIFSDEMRSEDLMLMAIAIHSANPEFSGTHPPLNAFKVIVGKLDANEVKVFREVQDHFVSTAGHGRLRIYDSADFTTLGSVMQVTVREHAKRPVDLVWLDYLTRMPLDVKYLRRGIDHTTGMNLTIQEAKHWAMAFDGGVGLAVCSAFQINREGLRKGAEAGGRLDARHLAQYNATEKEADLITYSWYGPEEHEAHEVKMGMIKNRWGPLLQEPVSMFYQAESRMIYELGGGAVSSPGFEIEEL